MCVYVDAMTSFPALNVPRETVSVFFFIAAFLSPLTSEGRTLGKHLISDKVSVFMKNPEQCLLNPAL